MPSTSSETMGEAGGWLFGLARFTNHSSLGMIRELLSRLGNPQDSFRSIHVAGSDGKGSTCAFAESVLRASGIRTGLYTSPHILRPNERIRVCGRPVDDGTFVALVSRVREVVDAMVSEGYECTFFEAVTAMAFLHFRDAGVEYAVVEVGLGGRFDATNVIVPEVSVICNISLEHTQVLGDTIEKIALEKAGIIKPGVPVVTCNGPPALDVIRSVAEGKGAELFTVQGASEGTDGSGRTRVSYRGYSWRSGIPGSYQSVNSAMACEALLRTSVAERVKDHIGEGMESAVWPGRMQRVEGLPLVIDVTHTAAGMRSLRDDVLGTYGRTVTVFGVLDDKDVRGMAESVSEMSEAVITVRPESGRALSCERITEEVRRFSPGAEPAGSFGEAMERAFAVAGGRTVLVTGSFAMAESAFRWLEDSGRPSPSI